MANLLYLTCNLTPQHRSRTLSLGNEFLKEYLRCNPRDEVRFLDLYRDPIPRLDLDVHNIFCWMERGEDAGMMTDEERRKMIRLWRMADLFSTCDKYVFVTHSLNLWFPAEFKMYIDAICNPIRTCCFSCAGIDEFPSRKSLHIHAPSYPNGSRRDSSADYLSSLLSSLGISNHKVVLLDGDDVEAGDNEQCEQARRELMDLAALF